MTTTVDLRGLPSQVSGEELLRQLFRAPSGVRFVQNTEELEIKAWLLALTRGEQVMPPKFLTDRLRRELAG